MSTVNGPSDHLLLQYASGVLDPGLRLLVDAHLERVPAARRRLDPFLALGGEMLDAIAPAQLAAGSLDRALARIAHSTPDIPDGTLSDLPLASEIWSLGRQRWAGPGCNISPVHVEGARSKVFLMRIAPGRAMLSHGHSAREWTVILDGSYSDESGHFSRGSFIEEAGDHKHRPVVDSTTPCVCLIASEGPLIASGVAGLMARWLLR